MTLARVAFTALAACAAVMLGPTAWAQPSAATVSVDGPRIALLIGNAKYSTSDGALPDLANPCNDVEAVEAKLLMLGWKSDNIVKLCDVDKTRLVGAIDDFLHTYDSSDRPLGLLYLAGHGVQVDKETYFFGVGSKPDLAQEAMIRGRDPKKIIFKREASDVVSYITSSIGYPDVNGGALLVVLDACRSNPIMDYLRKARIASVSAPRVTRVPHGMMIAFSTSDGDVAADGQGANSPFAEALVDAMSPSDAIDEVINAAANKVMTETRGTSREQVPTKFGTLTPPRRCFGPCGGQTSLSPRPAVHASMPTLQKVAYFQPVSPPAAPAETPAPAKASNASATRVVYERQRSFVNNLLPRDPEIRLDVFWCDGDDKAESRRALASEMAGAAAAFGRLDQKFGGAVLTRVRVRPLDPAVNQTADYRLAGNVVLVDEDDAMEVALAKNLTSLGFGEFRVSANPVGSPQYVSAFVCSDVNLNALQPRVFFQMAKPEQEPLTRAWMNAVSASVPDLLIAKGVDLQEKASPDRNEVRYYHRSDFDKARAVATTLETASGKVVPVRLVTSNRQAVRPGTLEVWVGQTQVATQTGPSEDEVGP